MLPMPGHPAPREDRDDLLLLATLGPPVTVLTRMAPIGSYIGMFCPELVELFQKGWEVWPLLEEVCH